MRIRFFTPLQQLPQQPAVVLPKRTADEESIREDAASSTNSSSQYSEEDSTSIEDNLSFEQLDESETPLPEMSLDQAASLKRLLLSPLEPEIDF